MHHTGRRESTEPYTHLVCVCPHRDAKGPSQPKVCQLELVVLLVNQQVLWLEVPVQDAAWATQSCIGAGRGNVPVRTMCRAAILGCAIPAKWGDCLHTRGVHYSAATPQQGCSMPKAVQQCIDRMARPSAPCCYMPSLLQPVSQLCPSSSLTAGRGSTQCQTASDTGRAAQAHDQGQSPHKTAGAQ